MRKRASTRIDANTASRMCGRPISVRLAPHERELLVRAAAQEARKLSDFLRLAGLRAAQAVVDAAHCGYNAPRKTK